MRRQKSVPFFYFSLFKIIAFINFSISKVAFGNIECEEDLAKLAQIESQKTDSLDLDELIRVFNRPLKNQEDLDVLVKSLEILDSEAGDMIRKARNAGVQIKIGNKSHVQRDFNQILNRSTSFAKSVIIARDSKTSLFEIIHEIRHAIPHPEGGVALNLDPKTQSVEHMEESLLRHFYLDEAHSIEAEIKFMQSLESLGLDFNYDAIRPGVRNVYQQEGVQGVADNLPLLVPNYEKHYKKLSRALVGELVNPSTSTRNKSWSYAGVEIKSSPDRIELSLDSRRLLESISDTQHPLAQLIAPLIEKAKAAFKKISESDLNANAKLTEKKTDREILKKIKFNPREEPTEKLAVIESQAQQNIERVKIAAHYLDILEQQVAAGITEGDHFYDYLSVAETSYGHRSSEIYQKLLDDVLKDTGKAVDEKTYKKRRDLGYSLIRSGYKKEGRIILSNVIDEHLSSETVLDFGMPLFSELIKLDEISLAMKIIPYLETRLKNAINAHQRYELSKIRDYEAHYTKRGKIRVELFLAENNNRLVSYKEIREFRQKLYREGDLVLKQDNSHLIRENAFNSEDKYLEALGSVLSFSGHLVKASRDIQGRHPEMALLLNQVASRLDAWQIKLQERVVAQKIEDWQVRLGHFETRSGDSVYALSKRIEDLSNVNKEYNFCDKLQGAPITTASSLFKIGTRSSFQAALEILDKIPATAQKVIPFEEAAKNLPKDLSKEEFTAFLKAWEQVLDQASGALSEVNFVENIGRTNLNNTIQKTLAFKSRFPPSFHLTQLHSQQRLLMAKTLVERPETALKKRGRKIIANLSSTTEEYFNQRDYISHRHFVHGVRPSGWSIYQLNFFSPIDFKLAALVEISKVDSQNKAAYLKEAYELSKQVNLNPETESLHDFENKFYHQWLLAEALYKNNFTDEARELRTRMSSSCLSAERAHTKRVQDFDRMPEVKRDQDFNKKWALKSESESIKFWLQYLDSKMKANEALQLSRQGSTELAQNVASELVTAFANDVKQRRNRFDVHSMIQTAVSLAESPTLRELSIKALKVCHEKLALLRGDKEVFNNGIVYFMDQLKSSHLSLENQDTLLTELVKGLVPKSEGVNLDWKVVLDSGVPLLKVVESISETGLYPKAELESLRIVSKLTEKIHFNHDLGKYGNRAAIETLRKLFDEIALRHPELFRESNLITLQNLSGQTSHRKALTHLFPNVDQVSTSKPLVVEGKIDMLRLETGKFDRSQASVEVGRELRVAFVENNEARLRNALTAYEVLLDFDLAQLRAQNPNQKFLELSEIKGSSAFKDLESLLEAKLGRSDSHFDNRELAVLKTLFGARTQEVATSKYNLYRHFLNSSEAPIEAIQLSVEGLYKRGSIPQYVWNFFDQELRYDKTTQQRVFCNRLSQLLDDHEHNLPRDYLMAYIIKHENKADEFIKLLGKSKKYHLMSMSSNNKKNIDLNYIHSIEDFNRVVDNLLQSKDSNGNAYYWQPSLKDPLDIMAVHEKRFEWFMNFPAYLNAIKAVYVDQTYDCFGTHSSKYSFTPEHLEKEVSEMFHGFKLTTLERNRLLEFFKLNRESKDSVIDWPTGRGTITLSQFKEIFSRLSLSETQQDQLVDFLHGPPGVFTETVLETFGKIPIDLASRNKIEDTLLELKRDFISSSIHIDSFEKIPEVIKEQPELVRFLMTSYFRQLPFGQRDAILREFSEGDSAHGDSGFALRRFFELTGTEKIGQFLSTRRDLVPEKFRKDLEVFLENGEPSSFDEVRSTIEGEIGKPISAVFKSFKEKPLNVGTVGEVYEGVLHDGTRVVVKVITRSRREAILAMLKRLEVSCDKLQEQKERFNLNFSPMDIFDEFRRSIHEELGLNLELKNGEAIAKDLKGSVSVPTYHPTLSTDRILVQSFALGKKLAEITDPKIRKIAVENIGRELINQLLNTGVFHDDLHPGNFRIDPKTGHVELLDFGRIGILNANERNSLVPLLMAVKGGNVESIIEVIFKVSPLQSNFDKKSLHKALTKILSQNDISMTHALSKVFFECGNHGLPVNRSYLRVLKAVLSFEGTAKKVDDSFDFEKFVLTEYFKSLFSK